MVLNLAENMVHMLGYIADVQQFARLVQLKTAIEDVIPLLEDTTNFIIKYTSRSETGIFNIWLISDFVTKLASQQMLCELCLRRPIEPRLII